MSATVADIAAATKQGGVTLDTQSSSTIQTRYGASARDTGTNPAKGYFDSPSDAATVNAERFALMGTERNIFTLTVGDTLLTLDPSTVTPTISVTDAEHGVARNFLIGRMTIDLDNETTSIEIFG